MNNAIKWGFGGLAAAVLAVGVWMMQGPDVRVFELTAEAALHQLRPGVEVEAWTFGGTVPGQQIRVTEGDLVRVTLRNSLPSPTSIHWHGYPVQNAMDGIPGVTQNAVQPGESFTYEFTAATPGTYWYHSHQQSATQVDKGLYGTLIVDPKEPKVQYDKDFTLVFDEWSTSKAPMNEGQASGSHDAAEHGGQEAPGSSHDEVMRQMYNVFTVNGAAGAAIEPLQVRSGERVKLRLINAGFQTHLLHLEGQPFRVTDTDGQPIEGGELVTDKLVAVAPGERYDVEFTAGGTGFWIDDHANSPYAADLMIPVAVDGRTPSAEPAAVKPLLPRLDVLLSGKPSTVAELPVYNREVKLDLGNLTDASGIERFTINGRIAPDIPSIPVRKGDKVKVTFTNNGTADHPMHLHGHFFRVLSKSGVPVQGAPVRKDTLNVRPGETYEVDFEADNEGNWMFHCHDLHHAAAGMMTDLRYEGFRPAFTPDPGAHNESE